MIRRPPRSTLFPTRRSSDLVALADTIGQAIPFAGLFFAVKRIATTYLGPWFDQYRLRRGLDEEIDRKSTRLNSSHANISYAVFCLKKKPQELPHILGQRLST